MAKTPTTPQLKLIDGGREQFVRNLLHVACTGTNAELRKEVDTLVRRGKLSTAPRADAPPPSGE